MDGAKDTQMTEHTQYLAATAFLDFEAPAVAEFTERAVSGISTPVERAERLFLAVRDGIRYDPYRVSRDARDYRASVIAGAGSNWCVPKSVLLAAAARRVGIPARLGFADVLNHLSSEKLRASMGTDVFAWHGFAELWLDGRWVKLSTAFNRELCERFGVRVLEFDPVGGALMHPYDEAGNRHMDYVRDRGSFADLPLGEIFATFDEVYPAMPGGAQHDAEFHG